MTPRTWKGLADAWRKPVPPSAPCIHCQGRGEVSAVLFPGMVSCACCQGIRTTSPPVTSYKRCPDCTGGTNPVLEFEHLRQTCWTCQGEGSLVTRLQWNPLPWFERMRTWWESGSDQ